MRSKQLWVYSRQTGADHVTCPLTLLYFIRPYYITRNYKCLLVRLLSCVLTVQFLACFSFPLEYKFQEGKNLVCFIQWVIIQSHDYLLCYSDCSVFGLLGDGLQVKLIDGHRGSYDQITVIYEIDNQQGLIVQHREVCSIFCNYL